MWPWVFIFIFSSLLGAAHAATPASKQRPIFVIGQDVKAVNLFYSSIRQFPGTTHADYPDGFMVYTAINDLRGLSDPVDHGAGVNDADELTKEHPEFKIVQVGLFMRYMLKETISGGLDRNIIQLGRWIKNSPKDVYLRIGYEFDNPDNGYDPQEYIEAYRHIVDLLRKTGVVNVHFVWHTMAWSNNGKPAYEPLKWYPGDRYVDWVGISFFDAKRNQERDAAAALARSIHKPLMIAESSPFGQYTVRRKLEWMKNLFDYIQKNNVLFLSYIDVDWNKLPLFESQQWGDARLEKSSVLMKAWLKNYEKTYPIR